MNVDAQMQVHRIQVDQPPGDSIGPEQPGQPGIFRILHRHLRGRYPLAVTLAILTSMTCSVAGYFLTSPQYTSEALLKVSPTLPVTLYQTDESGVPPLFDGYVAMQASLVQTSRVFEAAVDDENLKKLGWPPRPEGITRLKNAITVSNRRGSQMITVQATCDDPQLAQAAVNAVIHAYDDRYVEAESNDRAKRIDELQQRRDTIDIDIQNKRTDIEKLSRVYNTDDLEMLDNARQAGLIELQDRIFELQQTIDILESTGAPAIAIDPAPLAEPTFEYLATMDEQLAGMLTQCNSLDSRIQAARRFGPKHMEIRRLEEQRQALETAISKRAQEVRDLLDNGMISPAPDRATDPSRMTLPQATELMARLTRTEQYLHKEVAEIGSTHMDLKARKADLLQLQNKRDEVAGTLEKLRVEKSNLERGRITPIFGDLPTQPSTDRRFQLAVLGALGGITIGIGLVFLVGVLKPTYRYLDEIEQARTPVPVLGTLPDLDGADDDLESLATLSVHHLRNMLTMQARPRDEGPTSFMITSARPGDGKTSLTVALGMSFAAQGARTLLVDADLIGHGLSPTMRLDVEQGLRQVAGHGSLDQFVQDSGMANLWVLPAGHSTSRSGPGNGVAHHNGTIEAEHLSADRMRDLLRQTRDQYDVILVDTGPLMGSLEANVVASAVDRVVLTVPRGQDTRLVRAALGRLDSLGAACAGLVFNRAMPSDLRSSMSTFSFHSQNMRTLVENESESGAQSRHALVRAILMSGAAHAPTDKNGHGSRT